VSSKRTLVMAGALAAGLVAVFLVFNYVRGIENRQKENVKLVDVYVAKGPIPEGTPGEQAVASGAIALSKVNAEYRPANAISSPDEIAAKASLFNISGNTIITQGMFVDPSEAKLSFQARLSNPDYVATTVQLDQVRAAGGFVSPGDYVNIMLVTSGEGSASVSMLYQKVRVLAVGSSVTRAQAQETGATASNGLLTFEVPQEAALLITAAAQSGGMYLTLVPDNFVPKPYPTVSLDAVLGLPGQDPNLLTPYGPAGFPGS
jgi:Flp pilus assembly protein CpaB